MRRRLGPIGGLLGLVLLSGCTQPLPDGTLPPPPGGDPTACTYTLTDDVTVPSLMENTPAACDYLVTGDITVSSSLSVAPGTVVQFDQDTRLSIAEAGSITAVGTPDARIRFEGRSQVKGFWYGLCFGDNRASRLEYVDILWAGKVFTGGSHVCSAAIGGVNGDGEPVTIKHSLIAGAYTHGLDAQTVPLGEFENNIFADNTEYGVLVSPDQVHKLDAASDYLGTSVGAPNGKPYVFFSGFLKGDGSRVTWRKLNAPYLAEDFFPYDTGSVILDGPVTVTVEPGARFEFGAGGALNFWDGPSLLALGTAEAPVVFTGKEKTPGAWDGLLFQNAGASVLEHAEVSYGGAEGGSLLASGNLIITGVDGSDVTVRNSLITHSATCGVSVSEDSTFQQSGNTYSNNAQDLCD